MNLFSSRFNFRTRPFLGLPSSQLSSVVFATFAAVTLAGCLETRSSVHEQDEKVVMRSQVASLQKNTADINSRFQDIEDDIRRLSGKAENHDNRMGKLDTKIEKQDQAALAREKDRDEKLAAYREDITRLNSEVEQLKSQMAAQSDQQKRTADAAAQAQSAQAAAAQVASEKAAKNPYASAQEKFETKNWKEAILDFEKYRKANPKGKNFPTATYKIGASFQELGLAEDAKAFYEEVISKYPKSHDAELALKKLKGLKKK